MCVWGGRNDVNGACDTLFCFDTHECEEGACVCVCVCVCEGGEKTATWVCMKEREKRQREQRWKERERANEKVCAERQRGERENLCR